VLRLSIGVYSSHSIGVFPAELRISLIRKQTSMRAGHGLIILSTCLISIDVTSEQWRALEPAALVISRYCVAMKAGMEASSL